MRTTATLLLHSQVLRLEGIGQQFCNREGVEQFAVSIGDQDHPYPIQIRTSTWRQDPHGEPPLSVTTAMTSKSMLAFGDGLEDRHTFGADAGWIGGILDVDAGVDPAGLRPQRRADGVFGIGRVRMHAAPRSPARSVVYNLRCH